MPKILFIDDEPEFVRPQISALEEMGYDVTFKSDPYSAIAVLENQQFDLIILDLIMPPYNDKKQDEPENKLVDESIEVGEKLHRELRERLKVNTPIIFLTVIRDHEIRNGIGKLERKHNQRPHFLTKPISSNAVVDEVEKVIKESRIRPSQDRGLT